MVSPASRLFSSSRSKGSFEKKWKITIFVFFIPVTLKPFPLLVWKEAREGEPVAVLYLVVPHVPHSVGGEKFILEFPQ